MSNNNNNHIENDRVVDPREDMVREEFVNNFMNDKSEEEKEHIKKLLKEEVDRNLNLPKEVIKRQYKERLEAINTLLLILKQQGRDLRNDPRMVGLLEHFKTFCYFDEDNYKFVYHPWFWDECI